MSDVEMAEPGSGGIRGAASRLLTKSEEPIPPLYTRIRYAVFLLFSFMICVLVRDGLWGGLNWLPFTSGCAIPDTPQPPAPPSTPLPTYANYADYAAQQAKQAAAAAAAAAAQSAQSAMASGMGKVTGDLGNKVSETVQAVCEGAALVYRFSFALSLFFLAHMMLQLKECCCVNDSQKNDFQANYFCVKIIFFIILLISTIWMPNGLFTAYAKVCLVGSGIFLVLQVILLIDFVYDWNDSWARGSEEDPRWGVYLVLCTIGAYIGAIVLVILMYVWFTQGSGCDLNGFVITSTLLAGILGTGLSIKLPHGSIFVSGAVLVYCLALVFSAIKDGDSNEHGCNKLASDTPSHGLSWSLILNSLFVGLSVAWAAASAGTSRGAFSLEEDSADEGDDEIQGRNYFFFHLVMMLGSMYMAMLLTNWGNGGDDNNPLAVASGTTSMWVKIISEWMSLFAFFWSLLAPVTCCKHREYDL